MFATKNIFNHQIFDMQISKYLIVFPLQALVDFRSCQVPDFASDPVAVLTSPHPGIEVGQDTN